MALLCLKGHTGTVTAVGLSRDGKVASGSEDRTARVWDAETGKLLATVEVEARAPGLSSK